MYEFEVVVHPRSRKAKVAFVADVLHIWVTAPPVDGAANDAVIGILAKTLGVPRNHVVIVRGVTTRHKRVAIMSLTEAEVRAKVGE